MKAEVDVVEEDIEGPDQQTGGYLGRLRESHRGHTRHCWKRRIQ